MNFGSLDKEYDGWFASANTIKIALEDPSRSRRPLTRVKNNDRYEGEKHATEYPDFGELARLRTDLIEPHQLKRSEDDVSRSNLSCLSLSVCLHPLFPSIGFTAALWPRLQLTLSVFMFAPS